MAREATRRQPWADVAKGLAMLAVVFYHAIALAADGPGAKAWIGLGYLFFLYALPVFFIISGKFSSRAMAGPWPGFFAAKVWPSLYLFVAWMILYAVLAALTGGHVGATILDSVILKSTLWFLAALTMYQVAAWVFTHMHVLPAVQLVLTTLVALPIAIFVPFNGWGLGHTPHYFVAFVVGVLYASAITEWNARTRLRIAAASGAVAVVSLMLVVAVPISTRVVYALLPIVAVPTALAVSQWLARLPGRGLGLARVGDQSLVVYLVHPPVIQACLWASQSAGLTTTVASAVFPLAAGMFAVGLALVIARYVGSTAYVFQAPALARSRARHRAGRKRRAGSTAEQWSPKFEIRREIA